MGSGASLRRALVIAAISLGCLLLIVTGMAAWLLGTESGLRFAVARTTDYLPDGIEIGEIEGAASGPLVVQDVRVEMKGFTLELDRLELEWRLAALFAREIMVDRLYGEGLRYTAHATPPPEEQGEPFALPERIDLPVDIFVRDALVRDISLQTGAEGEPLIVDAVRLQAQWTDRALDIENLQVGAPLADLRATAHIAPRDAYPLEAEVSFTLRPPGYAPLAGDTQLEGSLQRLELTQSLEEPYNLHAEATLQDVLQELSFDATIEVQQAELARIAEALPAAVASTQIEARGNLSSIRVDLTARATEPQIGAIDAVFTGELSPELIAIERLVVDLANEAAHLEANGRVELSGTQPAVDVDAQWAGLQWPLHGAPQVASESGRLDVTGTLDEYRARLEAELSVPNQADGKVMLAGTGDAESFAFSAIDIATLEGTLNGTANVAWAPALAGSVDLQGRGLNPGGLLNGWPGAIDLEVRGEGRMPETGPVGRVETLHAEGRLRDQPIELDARGRYANDQLELETFHLRSGSTEVEADGRIGEQLAVNWSLASEDLSTLLPVAGGSVQGRGSASGPLTEPRVSAEISGSGLRYETYELASLELDADVDVAGETRSDLDLELRDASIGDIEIESFSLNGTGTRLDHMLDLEARTSAGRLDLSVDGSLDPDLVWAFVIERLYYAHPDLTPWSLHAPAPGQLSAEASSLERMCLTGGEALLCVAGESTPELLAAVFELEDLPLALANPFLPPAVRIDGSIGGTGNIRMARGETGEAATPVAHISLSTTPIRLLAEGAAQEMQPVLAFAPGEIALDLNAAEGATFALDLPLETDGGLEANATIAAGANALTERPLEGRFRARLSDIGFLTEFAPQIASLGGRVDGDLGVTGTLAAPALEGSLELLDGVAMLSGPEIRLREVYAAVRGQGGGDLDIEMRASSGGGTLRIDGSAGMSEAGPRGQLAIEGEDFRVFNTPEAMVRVTPDLNVTLADNRLEVTGLVRVPTAEIELAEAPASAVGVSDDQIIVQPGVEEAATADELEVAARVRVLLGEDVSFSGFGLTAALEGDLTVIETPGEPTTATGEINVEEGAYAAYGQELEIERGRVLFAGG
ncbi:MAG: translocation/assembly module TamB domain-containing protein, partial [Gammaproteobacteria bacterium]|nr:translocation/assembly module TamB domain-containing protein [Gammaproteobacteria bacterium]